MDHALEPEQRRETLNGVHPRLDLSGVGCRPASRYLAAGSAHGSPRDLNPFIVQRTPERSPTSLPDRNGPCIGFTCPVTQSPMVFSATGEIVSSMVLNSRGEPVSA